MKPEQQEARNRLWLTIFFAGIITLIALAAWWWLTPPARTVATLAPTPMQTVATAMTPQPPAAPAADPIALKLLRDGARRSKTVTLSDCEDREGRLYYRNKLVIPDSDELKIKILRTVYNSLAGGHPGRGKTLKLIQREYY